MSGVWIPLKRPPPPGEISGLSPDAERVLLALKQRHEERMAYRQSLMTRPDPQKYYKTLYNKQFGTSLPNKTDRVDSISGVFSQPPSEFSTPRLYNLGTPSSSNNLNITKPSPLSNRDSFSYSQLQGESEVPEIIPARNHIQPGLQASFSTPQRSSYEKLTENSDDQVDITAACKGVLDQELLLEEHHNSLMNDMYTEEEIYAKNIANLSQSAWSFVPPPCQSLFHETKFGTRASEFTTVSRQYDAAGDPFVPISYQTRDSHTEAEACLSIDNNGSIKLNEGGKDRIGDPVLGQVTDCHLDLDNEYQFEAMSQFQEQTGDKSPPLDLSPPVWPNQVNIVQDVRCRAENKFCSDHGKYTNSEIITVFPEHMDCQAVTEPVNNQRSTNFDQESSSGNENRRSPIVCPEHESSKDNEAGSTSSPPPGCGMLGSNLNVKGLVQQQVDGYFASTDKPNHITSSSTVSQQKSDTLVEHSNDDDIHVGVSKRMKFGTADVKDDSQQIMASSIERRLQEIKSKRLWKNCPSSESSISATSTGTHSITEKRKPQRRPKFALPVKQTKHIDHMEEDPVSADINRITIPAKRLVSSEGCSEEELAKIKEDVLSAEEVAMTLVYKDGSSQLQPNSGQVHGIVIAFPSKTNQATESMPLGHLGFLELSFKSKDHMVDEFNKDLIVNLMEANTRKLCYGAQHLMYVLLNNQNLSSQRAVLHWRCMDPKVAAWLLNPDRPPTQFRNLLVPHQELSLSENKDLKECICEDLSLLGPLMMKLYKLLKDQGLWELFLHVEMALVPVLAAMQLSGLHVDEAMMFNWAELLKKKLRSLEKSAHKEAGHTFLISSHCQLRQVLFEELKLDVKLSEGKGKIARTSVKHYKSTSESVLNQLQAIHPLPKIVLEYRQLQKLKSTYIDGMLECLKGSSVFTTWDHTSAATGRLASTNPNMQSVPKQPVTFTLSDSCIIGKEPVKVEICARDCFVATDGWRFLAVDFCQIELKLLAHLSNDQSLLDLFKDPSGVDIFSQLTAQWLCKAIDQVTSTEREQTKRIVYSVMYGAGKERLAEYLQVSCDNAKAIMSSFLVTFPCIKRFTNKCVDQTRDQGFQTTIFGRRRWFSNINHTSGALRSQAERQAVNFCVQGSAADLCKAAMIQVDKALATLPNVQAKLLLQIHDELLLEVKEEHVDEVTELVKRIMESAPGLCGEFVQLRVPLTVSITVGKRWGHMQPYKVR